MKPTRRPLTAAFVLAWGVLFFAALQLALNVVVEGWHPEWRDAEYTAKRSRLRACRAANPTGPVVLVIGSSRPATGFRPEVLPPCHTPDGRRAIAFNYALNGSGPVLELICLRRLLADGLRPERVFIECWPPSWHQEGDAGEDDRIRISRLTWADLCLLARHSNHPARLQQEWWRYRLTPWLSLRFVLMNHYAPTWLPWEARQGDVGSALDRTGWKPCSWGTTAAERQQARAQAQRLYTQWLEHFHLSAAADSALREMLDVCRREGIAATLLFMPESAPFQDCYPPTLRVSLDGYLRDLAAEYHVALVDARCWMGDEDFADGFHLRPQGADTFTTRFGREVLEPLLQGTSGVTTPSGG